MAKHLGKVGDALVRARKKKNPFATAASMARMRKPKKARRKKR